MSVGAQKRNAVNNAGTVIMRVYIREFRATIIVSESLSLLE